MEKACTHCGGVFQVSDQERVLLARFDVPDPKVCPDCRQRHRLAFRNERTLYRRDCDMCKKSMISMYSPDKQLTVYCPSCWWSDEWDETQYGRDFDFSRTFFEQYAELKSVVPHLALHIINNENSAYANLTGYSKNCYLLFASEYSEDCHYGSQVIKSRDCIDGLNVYKSESCYEVSDVENCYRLFFSMNCNSCSDSMFLYDCRSCSDCLFCTNLRNKRYYIFNEPHSKEEYLKKKEDLFEAIRQSGTGPLINKFGQICDDGAHKAMHQLNNEASFGDYIFGCKKCDQCFDLTDGEDCRYVYTGFKVKDIMDVCHTTEAELAYQGVSIGYNAYNNAFVDGAWTSSGCRYGAFLHSSHDTIGCIALKNKRYGILNKIYDAEEYHRLYEKIVQHMKGTGEWGQYFPASVSGFGYNETMANDYYPLKKEQAEALGFNWSDYRKPDVEGVESEDVIRCANSGRLFRLTPYEKNFYHNMGLPSPNLHPDERHRRRLSMRTPRKVFDGSCSVCDKDLKTSHAPDDSRNIYCDECYLKEVV